MAYPPNTLNKLINDDWHTRLLGALKMAKAMTASPELLNSMQLLEQQLAEIDECHNTVTAVLPASDIFKGSFLLPFVQECCDVMPSEVCLKPDGSIEVTVTARGSRMHVQRMGEAILSAGVNAAKSKLQVEEWLRGG